MLEAFTDGINAYAKSHPNEIDEVNKLILPAKPEDCLAHFQRVVLFHFVTSPQDVKFNPGSMIKDRGSNTWAIGPSRSASGNAMLMANPHLPWFDMFTWFEAHTVSSDLNAYGAGFVGMPFLGIAFNEKGCILNLRMTRNDSKRIHGSDNGITNTRIHMHVKYVCTHENEVIAG